MKTKMKTQKKHKRIRCIQLDPNRLVELPPSMIGRYGYLIKRKKKADVIRDGKKQKAWEIMLDDWHLPRTLYRHEFNRIKKKDLVF